MLRVGPFVMEGFARRTRCVPFLHELGNVTRGGSQPSTRPTSGPYTPAGPDYSTHPSGRADTNSAGIASITPQIQRLAWRWSTTWFGSHRIDFTPLELRNPFGRAGFPKNSSFHLSAAV